MFHNLTMASKEGGWLLQYVHGMPPSYKYSYHHRGDRYSWSW